MTYFWNIEQSVKLNIYGFLGNISNMLQTREKTYCKFYWLMDQLLGINQIISVKCFSQGMVHTAGAADGSYLRFKEAQGGRALVFMQGTSVSHSYFCIPKTT